MKWHFLEQYFYEYSSLEIEHEQVDVSTDYLSPVLS